MGRSGLVVGAVVLVGVALWLVAGDQRPPSEEALPDGSSAPVAAEPPREPGAVAEPATPPGSTPGEREEERTKDEPPTAPPTAAPPPPDAPLPAPERSGPVAELKQAFEKQPRDSAARAPEQLIESEFRKSDVAPGLLKSVLCRESVCRVEVHWTPERASAYMSAFTRLSAEFEPDIAIDPHTGADSQQALQVDVYLPRRGPGAKPPAP